MIMIAIAVIIPFHFKLKSHAGVYNQWGGNSHGNRVLENALII